MNIIRLEIDDIKKFAGGTKIIDYKDMIYESSYPLQSFTSVHLCENGNTMGELMFAWRGSSFLVALSTKDNGFIDVFEAWFDKYCELVVNRGDNNVFPRVNSKPVGMMLIILFIEYFISNPKKILRETLNTTHKCSNKQRKQLYRALKVAQIQYEPKIEKGHHKSPEFEFEVRGHWRTYNNGKRVWINPYTKCKGNRKKLTHEYMLKN